MTDARQPLIFVSHSTRDPRDSERAHSLAAGLQRCGARTWIAPDSIPSGADWQEQLVVAIIDQATHFLVILSAASTRAEWVLKELDLARQRHQRDKTLTILPIVVGEPGVYEGSTFVDRLQRIPYQERYTDQLRAIAAAVGLRADLASLIPLTMPSADTESRTSFDLSWLGYRRRQAQLVGRDAEKAALQAFYDDPEPLKWWVIDGPGGVGKSRLALESLHALPEAWLRGFLDSTGLDAGEVGSWMPEADTVVVIDDAAESIALADALLRHLERRKGDLTRKARVLLIERMTESQNWWAEIRRQGRDGQAQRMAAFHGGEPLSIGRLPIDHQAVALRAFLDSGESAVPVILPGSGDPFWSTVNILSDHGRPLFLGLIAAAIAELGAEHVRAWSSGALVEFVHDREMTTWERLYPDDTLRRRVRDIVAIATACRGFNFERQERQITECLTSLNLVTGFDDGVWEAVASLTGSPNSVMEPDILGEYFVTRAWHKPSGRPAQPVVSRLVAAFDLRPAALSYTVRNAVFDFPDAETPLWWMETLAKERCSGDHRLRIMDLFVKAVRVYGDARQLERMEQCLQRVREWARGLAEFRQEHNNLSTAATSAAVAYARAERWPEVDQLLQTLRTLAAAFPAHANLQVDLIRSVDAIVAASGQTGRLETLEHAIGALEDVERRHPHMHAEALAHAASQVAFHLIDSDHSSAIARCLRMTQRLAMLQGGYDEPHVRLRLAATAYAGVRHNLRLRHWSDTCWAYLVLAEVTKERGSEDRIKMFFDSAHGLLFDLPETRDRTEPLRRASGLAGELREQPPLKPDDADTRVDALRSLAHAHAGNLVVATCFADGLAAAISIYARADDVQRIDAALEELRTLRQRFPESLEIRDRVALGLDYAVEALPDDVEGTNAVLGELRALDVEVKTRFWHMADVAQRLAQALARAVRHHARSGNAQLVTARLDELDAVVRERCPWRDEMAFALTEALRDAIAFFAQANRLEDVRALAARLLKLTEHSHEQIVSTVEEAARIAARFYRSAGLESEAVDVETRLEGAANGRLPPPTEGRPLQLMAVYRDSFAPAGIQSSFEANV